MTDTDTYVRPFLIRNVHLKLSTSKRGQLTHIASEEHGNDYEIMCRGDLTIAIQYEKCAH
jgi:hypothetical protein